MSDSTSNVVYQEMTKINLSTTLNINIRDAGTENLISEPVEVSILVPQKNSTKTYKQTITGNGNIKISYPRYSSDSTQNTPEVKINVYQTGTNQKYKQCNFNKTNSDYSFLTSEQSYQVKVEGSIMNTDVYVKAYQLSVPTLQGRIQTNGEGTFPQLGTTQDDNKKIFLAYKNSENKLSLFDVPTTQTTTYTQGDGANNSIVTHGVFSNLGTGATWTNTTYTEKFTTTEIYLILDCGTTENKIDSNDKFIIKEIRSDVSSENLGVLNFNSATTANTLAP